MSKNYGYKAFDLTRNEEIRIHSPKEYKIGEIIEMKAADYLHECKILETLPEESEAE